MHFSHQAQLGRKMSFRKLYESRCQVRSLKLLGCVSVRYYILKLPALVTSTKSSYEEHPPKKQPKFKKEHLTCTKLANFKFTPATNQLPTYELDHICLVPAVKNIQMFALAFEIGGK